MFRRPLLNEHLTSHADGTRVLVRNFTGNILFDGTLWLFEQCWRRGYFINQEN